MKFREVDAFLTRLLDGSTAESAAFALDALPVKDREALRDALVQRLGGAGEHGARQLEVFSGLLRQLGIGRTEAALTRLVHDKSQDVGVRRVAANALLAAGRRGFFDHLDLDAADALFEEVARGLLTSVSDPGATLASILAQVSLGAGAGPGEAVLVAAADAVRRETGRSYAEFFGPAIEQAARAGKPLAPSLIPALVAAADGEAEAEVQALLVVLRELSTAHDRPAVQRAVLQTGTASVTPPAGSKPAPAGAKGHLGGVDGSGAVVVLATLPQADGTVTLINMCYRLIGDVRDGFVVPRRRRRDILEIIEQFRASTTFAEVPFEHIAALCVDAADRTLAAGLELPKDAIPALRLLRPHAKALALEPVTPAPRITLAAVRALLARPEYAAWFFDFGDFAAAGLRPQKVLATPARIGATLTALKGTRAPERVVALAGHQARWHVFKGETAAAELLVACQQQAESDFEHSALARVMVERGVEELPPGGADEPEVDLTDHFGPPDLRRATHRDLFGDRRPTRAVDLAHLDFAVAVRSVLDRLGARLGAEFVPRAERVAVFADALAKAGAERLIASGPAAVERFEGGEVFAPFRGALEDLFRGAPAFVLSDLARDVQAALDTHVQALCAECPIQCFAHPRRSYREPIEFPVHPVALAMIQQMKKDGLMP